MDYLANFAKENKVVKEADIQKFQDDEWLPKREGFSRCFAKLEGRREKFVHLWK